MSIRAAWEKHWQARREPNQQTLDVITSGMRFHRGTVDVTAEIKAKAIYCRDDYDALMTDPSFFRNE